MRRSFVFFDFDGVITDSYWLAYESGKAMHPHLSEAEHRALFEGNIYETDRDLACTDECDPRHESLTKRFTAGIHRLKIVPGLPDCIAALAERYTLVIISSSTETNILSLLKKFGIDRYFADVFGQETHTSKVDKIKIILARYEITPADCVFITDTLGDMREAAEMKVETIGVPWGFHAKETLEKGNPFRIVEKPEDLVPAVEDFFETMYAGT